jgi:copper(I)-binding protein|tara:strand:- start:3855 stop:4301 length:447 start_codon:yes stop_codon:yes gene_type:complete
MKLMRFFLITLTVLSINSYANQAATDQVKFANAWVKKPMPGMQMTAGFVEIENVTDSSLRLVAVRTSFSAHSELHSMIMVDNVMQMRQVADGWLIAPGSILTLSPGGKHVMLMGLKQNMKNLSEVTLEFNIEGIGWVAVPADVRAPKI